MFVFQFQRVSIPRFFSSIWNRSISTSNLTQDEIARKGSKRCKPGQNLTKRYQPMAPITPAVQKLSTPSSCSLAKLTAVEKEPEHQFFYGQKVPAEPTLPPDDCCGKCVYDLYEEKLGEFRESVAAIRDALVSMQVPESEWPAHIQTKSMLMYKGTEGRQTAVLTAFEEMERVLAQKRQVSVQIS
ncbi:hypothetical protein CVT24_007385 [Panaeolus cyanescens]|uniref:Oxidoreductase-like domain-containing protein n=1 Tax=Panaeolus cyanescens TaxID=181874 RepID=A0A409YKZ0_9AGAR|nr:hypothetical protein CVT24_007385 [Panaeolus cyanescens]